MIKLVLRKKNENLLTYSVSLLFRIPCIILAAALVVGAVSIGEFSFFPIFVCLIALVGALYRECWKFDRKEKKISYAIGVGPFVKREEYSFNDVLYIGIDHFVRGEAASEDTVVKPNKKGRRAMMQFYIALKNQGRRDIEIIPERSSGGRTEKDAYAIAVFTGLRYSVDREKDPEI